MDYRCTRRTIIIKPYQVKLAATLFVYITIISVILGFVIFYPLYNELDAAKTLEEQSRISGTVLYLHKRVWLGLFIVAVISSVHAIFSSHRVVGPVYRFERMVEDLLAGNYGKRIKIRKKDEFKEMEILLNRLAEDLDIAKTRDKQFYGDVKIRLETISAMLEAEGAEYPEDVKRLMQSLIAELNSRGYHGTI